jgi:hypothetical protein
MNTSTKMRNPGVQAGAPLFAPMQIRSPHLSTPAERQAQFLAHRFSLPLSTARHVAFLAYGGGSHE